MIYYFSPSLAYSENEFEEIIRHFNKEGILIGDGGRNVVKYFNINGININFKSFREPNVLNKIVYRYFRKSKAKRSFENASFLLSKGLRTPEPIAYLEHNDLVGLSSSYYVCKQLDDVVELRNVISVQHFPEREKIIRKYTGYFFSMHEHGIEFLDNSPGNTLVKKEGEDYELYLVDLNRMNFKKRLSIRQRMQNFSRLTTDNAVLKIIADEYAKLSRLSFDDLYPMIISAADDFRKSKLKKKNLKKKLGWIKK